MINDAGMVYMDEYKIKKPKQKRPTQHELSPSPDSTYNIQTSMIARGPKPTLPQNPTHSQHSVLSPTTKSGIKGGNDESLQSHHHKSILSSSSVLSDGHNKQPPVSKQDSINTANSSFQSIPNPANIGDIDIPRPMEAVIDIDPSQNSNNHLSSIKYEVSFVDTPTVPALDFPERVPIDEVNLGTADESELTDNDTLFDERSIAGLSQRRMPSVNINETRHNRMAEFAANDLVAESEEDEDDDDDDIRSDSSYVTDTDSDSDSDSDSADSDDDERGFGTLGTLIPQEEEKNICMRIATVLYENSWTGEMISNSTEFSRREYNALLDVGGVITDSYIANLVWKIIFYSQKKTEDDLINEDKPHIKWIVIQMILILIGNGGNIMLLFVNGLLKFIKIF